MTSQEAITKLTNIMHDDHYSWHPSILTAFGMAVDALKGAEGDSISRQTLKDAFVETSLLEWEQLKKCYPMLEVVDEVPSAQPTQTNTSNVLKSLDCIDRQAAIDALGERPMVWMDSDYEIAQRNQYDMDKLAIETVPSAQPEQRWIPVSERLPKQGQEVICQCRANIIKVLKLDADGDWYQDAKHCYMYGFVIAWMPLPESWKEGKADG